MQYFIYKYQSVSSIFILLLFEQSLGRLDTTILHSSRQIGDRKESYQEIFYFLQNAADDLPTGQVGPSHWSL